MAMYSAQYYVNNPEPIKGLGETEYRALIVVRVDPQQPSQMSGKRGIGYVLWKPGRTRPTRLLRCDVPLAGVKLGTAMWLGTGRSSIRGDLGRYVVVGCIDYNVGEQVGTVPPIQLAAVSL